MEFNGDEIYLFIGVYDRYFLSDCFYERNLLCFVDFLRCVLLVLEINVVINIEVEE